LQNITNLLTQASEKIIQAASDTQGASERSAIFQELNQLGEEIDSVASQTQFNGVVLLTATTMTFQTGPDGVDINRFSFSSAFTSAALAVSSLTVASQALASLSLGSVSAALTSVKTALQAVGALMNRFQVKTDNLSVARLNVTAASARIMDADLAVEQLEASKLQILQQTATAQLAAANTAPASILQLFR
jgi:flagellin